MSDQPLDAQNPDAATAEAPPCPKCGGAMWDNRESKRNPRAPDFKCRDKACDGVIWPPREAGAAPAASSREPAGTPDDPACPECGGKMWDDRLSKRNPRAPDFKCRNKPKFQGGEGCPGVIWPPREGEQRAGATRPPATGQRAVAPRPAPPAARGGAPAAPRREQAPPPPDDYRDFSGDPDDLPF